MSKYIDMLHLIVEGDNRGDLFISNELLKEAQELLAQPESKQEPVAWMWEKHTAGGWLDVFSIDKPTANAHQINIRPLYYTAPPKRLPLTPQQISEGNQSMFNATRDAFVKGVKFAEKHHGIGGGE